MKEKVALVGVGSNFFDILEELEKKNYEAIGYINNKKVSSVDLPYLGDDSVYLPEDVFKVITTGGIGKKIELRKRLYEIHKDKNKILNLFFKNSLLSKYVVYKENSGIIVFENAVIKAKCILGENIFINSSCVLGHDVSIGNHTQLSLGVLIGGHTVIGENCYIGMGAKIFQNVKIGDNSIIGANSLIKKSIPENFFVAERNAVLKTGEL